MVVFPNAKINIGLRVLNKRDDGYHNISSIFYPIPLFDVLEVVPNNTNESRFTSYGIPIPGDKRNNLCIKAYNLLKDAFNIPYVDICLFKNIPIGAGLGGGSSDGTFTLSALNELFNLKLSNNQLIEFAEQLGSDCPFFVENTPYLVSQKGVLEVKVKMDLSPFSLVVVNPGIHIATKEAYQELEMDSSPFLSSDAGMSYNKWETLFNNSFEGSIFQKYPEIRAIKDKLYEKGAVYASMSGSGSSVFAFFREKVDLVFDEDYLVKYI